MGYIWLKAFHKMRAVSISKPRIIKSSVPSHPLGMSVPQEVFFVVLAPASDLLSPSSSSSPELATTLQTSTSFTQTPADSTHLGPSHPCYLPQNISGSVGTWGTEANWHLLPTSISWVTVISSEYPRRWSIMVADSMSAFLSTFFLPCFAPLSLLLSLGSLSKSTTCSYTSVRLCFGENAG